MPTARDGLTASAVSPSRTRFALRREPPNSILVAKFIAFHVTPSNPTAKGCCGIGRGELYNGVQCVQTSPGNRPT